MTRSLRWTLLLAMGALTAAAQPSLDSVSLEPVVSGLDLPVYVTHAGDGTGQLYILERQGRILAYHPDTDGLPAVFLDIRERVLSGSSLGDERGLLGLAFHPDFSENGRFFVDYIDNDGDTVIAQYTAAGGVADPASETVFLQVDQPFGNHNGGQLAFGTDGFLYVGMGDGGSGGDPGDRAQDLGELLGKILRLDVDQGAPARAAAGNPFVGQAGARDEIWSYGWRNPWRFSFDRQTGEMFVGDVGQGDIEEISHEPAATAGRNYGWRLMEGSECFNPATGCNDGSLVLPILEYGHDQGRCSVTGGYVYRGGVYGELDGAYFFGDYCSGEIWAATSDGGAWSMSAPIDTAFNISSFGEGEDGALYVVDLNGSIYRLAGQVGEPVLMSDGVVNGASFSTGAIAPGMIVSVFGESLAGGLAEAEETPLPRALGGAEILIDGTAAPLFFVSPEQANVQAPWEIAGAGGATVQARFTGAVSETVTVAVAEASPGLFTMDMSGTGQAAALVGGVLAAPDGTFAGARPARIGETVELFATGLGMVAAPPVTGEPAPLSADHVTTAEPLVRVDVEPARVTYSGLAPGFVGLYQVNIELVGDFPAGGAVPVTLFVGEAESNTVTIAIE